MEKDMKNMGSNFLIYEGNDHSDQNSRIIIKKSN